MLIGSNFQEHEMKRLLSIRFARESQSPVLFCYSSTSRISANSSRRWAVNRAACAPSLAR